MKALIKIICILFFFGAKAQSIQVDYLVHINANDEILSTRSTYSLVIKDYKTAYYNTTGSLDQFKYKHFIDEVKDIGELKLVQLDENHYNYITQDYFYKNHQKNELLYNEIIFNKKVIVKETIDLIDWEIIHDSDTLFLNQHCKKAIGKFRGRNYTAYFSDELSSFGGPWKFDNLPGLVLYVKSDDNYILIEPQKIDTTLEIESIKNPYLKEKDILSWDEFKSLFKERMMSQLKKLKSLSEEGESGSIEITDRIEDLGIKELRF